VNGYSWQGASGRWYDFDVARAKRAWEPTAGIFMFVKPSDCPTGEWGGPICLYLENTGNFSGSLERHNVWAAADQLGAKEIHLLTIPDAALRAQVERDLIEAQRPILNRQARRVA
jgi:hypothetical protein